MALPENFKETTNTLHEWTDAVGTVFRRYSRDSKVKRLLNIDAFIVAFLNKGVIQTLLDVVGIKAQLPSYYHIIWFVAIAILFLWAAFIKARQTEPPPSLGEQSCIKGTDSFDEHDHEAFKYLQREDLVKDFHSAIRKDSFRLGVVTGESGCGKTSLLRAGLVPALKTSGFETLVVTFTNEAPLYSFRRAAKKTFKDPLIDNATSVYILLQAVATNRQPKQLVVIIDQFEQFFTQNKEEDRQAFIADLKKIHDDFAEIKILLAIRKDFFDDCVEVQQGLKLTFEVDRNYFQVKKFKPLAALAIFKAVGQIENFEKIDEGYLKKIVVKLVSPTDGLVSPVDIQIILFSLRDKIRTEDAHALSFDLSEGSFKRSGGVTGLVEWYVKKYIDLENPAGSGKDLLKVLFSLIDLKDKTRKGRLTAEEIITKGLVSHPDRLPTNLGYLLRVRLIREIEEDAKKTYEVSHEMVIEPILKLYNTSSIDEQKANYLLDQRLNEWLSNSRKRRFLLTTSELLKLQKYKSFIIWGENKTLKEELLRKSRNKFAITLAMVALVVAIPCAIYGISKTEWYHYNFDIEREVTQMVKGRSVNEESKKSVLYTLALADPALGEELLEYYDHYGRSEFYSRIIKYRSKTDSLFDAHRLVKLSQKISDSSLRKEALLAIAKRLSQTNYREALKLENFFFIGFEKDQLLQTIMDVLIVSQPDTALKIAREISEPYHFSNIAYNQDISLGRFDYEKALSWLPLMAEKEQDEFLLRCMEQGSMSSAESIQLSKKIHNRDVQVRAAYLVARKTAVINPDSALAIVKAYPCTDTLNQCTDYYYLLQELAVAAGKKNPSKAKEFMQMIPAGHSNSEEASVNLVLQVAKTNIDSSLRLLDSLSLDDRKDYFEACMAGSLAQTDVQRSIRLAEGIQDTFWKVKAFVGIYPHIATESLKMSTIKKIAGLTSAYSHANSGLLDTITTINADTAVALIKRSKLDDQTKFQKLLDIAAVIIAPYPDKAEAILDGIPLTALKDNYILDNVALLYTRLHRFDKAYLAADNMSNEGLKRTTMKLELLYMRRTYRLTGKTVLFDRNFY